jgi:hypothetical protein
MSRLRIADIDISILPLTMVLFVNALFVLRYSPRCGLNPWLAACVYLALPSTLLYLARFVAARWERFSPRLYVALTVALCLIYFLLLLRVDPMDVRVDRWSAITSFNTALLQGSYPYLARTHLGNPASGLPALFLVGLPFQLAGDVGYLQIVVFMCFSLGAYLHGRSHFERISILLLLATSPFYFWEIAVRSELFSNTALFLLVLFACEPFRERKPAAALILLGLGAGLLCSTRVVALIPFLLYFPGFFKSDKPAHVVLFVACGVGAFALTLIPFAVWNFDLFLKNNPLIQQGDKAPLWVPAAALTAAALLGIRGIDFRKHCFYAAAIFFCMIAAALLVRLAQFGWLQTIYHPEFDISYFIFCVPYALFSLFESSSESPKEGAVKPVSSTAAEDLCKSGAAG